MYTCTRVYRCTCEYSQASNACRQNYSSVLCIGKCIYIVHVTGYLIKDTSNLIFHLPLSCADNLNPFRHEHDIRDMLAHDMERVSVKKKRTIRARVMDSAVIDHPGQRYGFRSLKFAIMELRTVKENIILLHQLYRPGSHVVSCYRPSLWFTLRWVNCFMDASGRPCLCFIHSSYGICINMNYYSMTTAGICIIRPQHVIWCETTQQSIIIYHIAN